MPVKISVRPAASSSQTREPVWLGEAPGRGAAQGVRLSARSPGLNGSGKFPNDFIGVSVRCPDHGCEGGGRRRRKHVHARAGRRVRHPRRPAPCRRAGAPRHRSGAARRGRSPLRTHDATGGVGRHAHPHRSTEIEAIDGAEYVVVQLRVGGNQARYRDETIPPRFGCIGQETTGPGGFAKALRTVPVVLELAELTARRGAPGRGSSTSPTRPGWSHRRCWTRDTARSVCAT